MRIIKLLDFGKEIAGYKAIKVVYDKDWQEYQVRFIFVNGEHSEADTYYTDDKEDAVDTAHFNFSRMLNMKTENENV